MHLYLVRHGQSYMNLADWDGDDWDQPLTPLGQQQAVAVAQWIRANISARHLYASTLKRATETAQAIGKATGLMVQPDTRLREVGANAPDGTPLPDGKLSRYIEGIWGTLQPYDPLTAFGENWMQFRSRVGSFIEGQLRAFDNHVPVTADEIAEQSLIVVCHGGVIEAFFEYVFEKGPRSVVSVLSSNTGITHLEYKPVSNRPAWRLHYHNRLEHLPADLTS
jgi:broad specificity phosphatase PhoE